MIRNATHLFVYGTLKRGDARSVLNCIKAAECPSRDGGTSVASPSTWTTLRSPLRLQVAT